MGPPVIMPFSSCSFGIVLPPDWFCAFIAMLLALGVPIIILLSVFTVQGLGKSRLRLTSGTDSSIGFEINLRKCWGR
jgi:hypothetical protein